MPRFGCNPGQIFNYWWGQEAHVTQCGVILLGVGLGLEALFPGLAVGSGLELADLGISTALSCDGTIYVDCPWGSPFGYSRPAC
jgi:hypothetical protein